MRRILFTLSAFVTLSEPLLAKGNIEGLQAHDQYGVFMSIIAMSVVFLALVVLWFCFTNLERFLNFVGTLWRHFHGLKAKVTPTKGKASTKMKVTDAQTGQEVPANDEVMAAIGMALFLAEDGMHDTESGVLTLNENSNSRWTGVGNNQSPTPLRKF